MAILNSKEIKVEDIHLKILVMGEAGTGKSMFARSFPEKSFVFDFDKGILSYRGRDFDYGQYNTDTTGWIEFEKDFKTIITAVKEGAYKTIILDSTTLMSSVAMERALQLDPKRSPSGGPIWNSHYGIVKNLVEGKLRQLLSLPCNVVVIAHTQIVKDEDSGAVVGIQPLAPGALRDTLPSLFDEVYFTRTKKAADGRTEYFLLTEATGFARARSRISGKDRILPPEIKNDYDAIMTCIKRKEEVKK
jgi:hypothetical protein